MAMEVGDMVLDTKRDRVGEVMQTTPTRVFLRAFGGGREWVAGLEDVTPVGVADALRAKVAEINARGRARP
ncbi:hypothetical protein [Streptomyces sp. ISL-11]|uniref:hypothetical protein n=1 Tax=Streptomyces sp. ISL-11 TaxID=2819174 RepID=UPI001BE9475C|nr:hypothetical protein [Streptomyces sp. ISL-11]MBT2385787.1 hypothetical protein [Streptomyces sp. ISL-11]